MAKFNESYENGKCPYGYEFVEGYTDRNLVRHESYCRKLKRKKFDPEEERLRKQRIREQKSMETPMLGLVYDNDGSEQEI